MRALTLLLIILVSSSSAFLTPTRLLASRSPALLPRSTRSVLRQSNTRAQLWRVPVYWAGVFQDMAAAGRSVMGGKTTKMSATAAAEGPPVFKASPTVPSWGALREAAGASATGKRLLAERAEREKGGGQTHNDATLRLFGKKESDIRVILYRDHAAWCPYCQKTWLLMEEKRIPYKIEKINMRSYGDKPDWFLKKVPRGLLPAVEIDGQMMTESLQIMQTLDQMFPTDNMMLPYGDKAKMGLAQELLGLERELFGAWCSYVFQPGERAKNVFESTMARVDKALGATPGPWFLGGGHPDLVDMQYVSHIERMLPSCLYWKGMRIRGSGKYPNVDAWFAAFEERPTYVATKGDFYTHVTDIPPQYGPGQPVEAAAPYMAKIDGTARDGWSLPLPPLSGDSLEPVLPSWNPGDEGARHEAALKISEGGEKVSKFACRVFGGEVGKWRIQGGGMRSALADPGVPSDERFLEDVSTALRHVSNALINGHESCAAALAADLGDATKPRKEAVVECLDYLRLRVSVPRDMSYPAARQFRAHIQWVMDEIQG